jgi:transcriptional regulator with XRE-family HTH domain
MSDELHELVDEALELAKAQGMNQKELADKSTLGEVAISRLKKANDAKFSTLLELGKSMGKKLIWVDDSDLATLVQKGELF